jgi:RNA polymerase-binding transcription factor DksA
MTHAAIEQYRQRLLALMHRLAQERSQLKDEALQPKGGEAGGGLSDVPLHLADLGTQSFDEEVTLTLLENEEQIIEDINGALARIEQGTFGRCEACRKKISAERLRAVPYARYCVRCAEIQGRPPGS